jgi:hypothetical protein
MSGLVTMTPTSIEHVGTSASINANGGVDFEGVTSLSLNGVFTGGDDGFDNYVIYLSGGDVSVDTDIKAKLRSNGLNTADTKYTRQNMNAQDASVNGSRRTSEDAGSIGVFRAAVPPNAIEAHFYGPALDQPTAWRIVTVTSGNGAEIMDRALTHSEGASYDGFTIYPEQNISMTGNLIVMGYAE